MGGGKATLVSSATMSKVSFQVQFRTHTVGHQATIGVTPHTDHSTVESSHIEGFLLACRHIKKQ